MVEILSKETGSYRLEEFISKTDQGDLYLATDIAGKVLVHVKCLNEENTRGNDFRGPGLVSLKNSLTIKSEYLCRIIDFFEDHGKFYVVTEILEGQNILEKFESSTIIYEEFLIYACMAAKGLLDIHSHGLIHGNIKPTNIIITNNNVLKYVDYSVPINFDLEKIEYEGETNEALHYLSPEVVKGQNLSRSSDLYALGAVFLRLLTGKYLYSGETNIELLSAIVNKSPNFSVVKEMAIPGETVLLLEKLLWKEDHGRFSSAEELLVTITEMISFKSKILTDEYVKDIHSPRDYMLVSLLAVFAILFWILAVSILK